MDLQFDAIYENGVLRPIGPVAIPEHAKVSVTVELQNGNSGPGGLNGCAGTITPEAAAEMRDIIEREFERVDEREW